eukprot:7811869-Pyramimonas_sp.AAC.1
MHGAAGAKLLSEAGTYALPVTGSLSIPGPLFEGGGRRRGGVVCTSSPFAECNKEKCIRWDPACTGV